MYEGKFLDMTMTCQYKVERNFTATKILTDAGPKPTVIRRRKSGKPASMQP